MSSVSYGMDTNFFSRASLAIADYPSFISRASLAMADSTTPEVLAILADDEHAEVRRWSAMRETTPEDSLINLAHDTEFRVRAAVAGNANAPRQALDFLVADHAAASRANNLIQHFVATNRATPDDILDILTDSANEGAAVAAMRSLELRRTNSDPRSLPVAA